MLSNSPEFTKIFNRGARDKLIEKLIFKKVSKKKKENSFILLSVPF